MAYAIYSKYIVRTGMWVRLPPPAQQKSGDNQNLTFIFSPSHGIIELISSVLKTMVYYDPNL